MTTEEMLAKIAAAMSNMESKMNGMEIKMATRDDLNIVVTTMRGIEERLDRQDKRLKALEDFPLFPTAVRPSSQFRATSKHSVSNATRIKVGYAG